MSLLFLNTFWFLSHMFSVKSWWNVLCLNIINRFVQESLLCVMKLWAVVSATRPSGVADMMIPGCLSCQSICSSCSSEKAPAPFFVGLMTLGRFGTCFLVRKTSLFIWSALVAVVLPKAADRYTQTGQAYDLHTLLFFLSFPDLNFHHLVPLLLQFSLHLAKQPPLFILFPTYPVFLQLYTKLLFMILLPR